MVITTENAAATADEPRADRVIELREVWVDIARVRERVDLQHNGFPVHILVLQCCEQSVEIFWAVPRVHEQRKRHAIPLKTPSDSGGRRSLKHLDLPWAQLEDLAVLKQ